MSKKQTALSTIPSHDSYVLKSSNNSRVKIMVSQKDVGRSNMDIRNIKRDAGKPQDSTGFEKKKEKEEEGEVVIIVWLHILPKPTPTRYLA